MGRWGTGIKDDDAFADVYSEFFDEYNKGGEPGKISKDIIEKNREILEIEAERNSLWFAIGLAQWETKSLDVEIFKKIKNIISSGDELNVCLNLGATENDIEKRRIVLDKFLEVRI